MRAGGDRGFTLMEILVAIFVLALGLAGIMAVFPAGIKMGNETVQDTYAGILAQSVTESFKVALRENRFYGPKGTYVVFDHDGVTDDPSTHDSRNPDYTKDYILLLPEYFEPTKTKTFIYPETSAVPNGNGNKADAEDDGQRKVIDRDGNEVYAITKTYQVGQFLKRRAEDPEVSDFEKREIIAKDPYTQYSFSLEISRARTDSDGNGKVDERDAYSNFLYLLRVNIYRNFQPEPKSKWNQPIHYMYTQVEM